MKFRCTGEITPGGQCQLDSTHVIIYSCFNEHIRERPMCDMHTETWLERFALKKWACNYCHKKLIEEIYLCLTSEVKVECLNI